MSYETYVVNPARNVGCADLEKTLRQIKAKRNRAGGRKRLTPSKAGRPRATRNAPMSAAEVARKIDDGLPPLLRAFTEVYTRTVVGAPSVAVIFARTKDRGELARLNAPGLHISIGDFSPSRLEGGHGGDATTRADRVTVQTFRSSGVPKIRKKTTTPDKAAEYVVRWFRKNEAALLGDVMRNYRKARSTPGKRRNTGSAPVELTEARDRAEPMARTRNPKLSSAAARQRLTGGAPSDRKRVWKVEYLPFLDTDLDRETLAQGYSGWGFINELFDNRDEATKRFQQIKKSDQAESLNLYELKPNKGGGWSARLVDEATCEGTMAYRGRNTSVKQTRKARRRNGAGFGAFLKKRSTKVATKRNARSPFDNMAWHSDPLVRDIYSEVDDRGLGDVAAAIMEVYQNYNRNIRSGKATKHLTQEESEDAAVMASQIVDWAHRAGGRGREIDYAEAYGDYSAPPWKRPRNKKRNAKKRSTKVTTKRNPRSPLDNMAWHSDPLVRDIHSEVDDRGLADVAASIMEVYQNYDRNIRSGKATKHLTQEESEDAAVMASQIVDWANYAEAYGDYSAPPWQRARNKKRNAKKRSTKVATKRNAKKTPAQAAASRAAKARAKLNVSMKKAWELEKAGKLTEAGNLKGGTAKKATPKKATPKKATPKKATPKKATPKKAAAKYERGDFRTKVPKGPSRGKKRSVQYRAKTPGGLKCPPSVQSVSRSAAAVKRGDGPGRAMAKERWCRKVMRNAMNFKKDLL